MNTGSPYSLFSTMRHRALYLLLPFANGVLLITGFAFANKYMGVPHFPKTELSGIVPYIALYLWGILELLALVMAIHWIDLLVLSGTYRLNFFRSLRRILGLPEGRPDGSVIALQSFFVSTMITVAGYLSAEFALDAFSLWPDAAGYSTFGITIVLGIVFSGQILPLITFGERSRTGG